MASGYTASELIESIKVRAAVPEAQNTFEDEDILRFANEEMDLVLIPAIQNTREEFYVYTEPNLAIPNSNRIKIPYRAIGGKVRDLRLSGSNNTVSAPLDWVAPEQREDYMVETTGMDGQFRGFYIEAGDIVLLPRNGTSNGATLSLSYYLKPNELVVDSKVATIIDVGVDDSGNRTIYVDQVPDNIQVGSKIDFIEYLPQYKTRGFDIIVVNTNEIANTITISADDVPDNLEVGDYINTATETFVVQAPPELHPMLAQAVACRILEALGFQDQLNAANNKLDRMSKAILNIIETRVESIARKAVNNNTLLRPYYRRIR